MNLLDYYLKKDIWFFYAIGRTQADGIWWQTIASVHEHLRFQYSHKCAENFI